VYPGSIPGVASTNNISSLFRCLMAAGTAGADFALCKLQIVLL
jgi:hypothetical protein